MVSILKHFDLRFSDLSAVIMRDCAIAFSTNQHVVAAERCCEDVIRTTNVPGGGSCCWERHVSATMVCSSIEAESEEAAPVREQLSRRKEDRVLLCWRYY